MSVVLPDPASIDALLEWAATELGSPIVDWHRISGGNRYLSLTITVAGTGAGADAPKRFYLRYQLPRAPSAEPYTVLREVEFYRLLADSAVPAAQLVAVNTLFPAVIVEHVSGIAEYRRVSDVAERTTIAHEFIAALATLHALPIHAESLPGGAQRNTMTDCARGEIADWKAMYEEVAEREPLIDLAFQWLEANVPHDDAMPVLAHGDAGPGNFLFEHGHLRALIDWEFAHLGDPHDDLAWFAMRCVMEPVPDFAACLRLYTERSGRLIDVARLRFYQVLVSTRVLVIRHRNVSGEYGNSIVSLALNRRLLTAALALANGIDLPVLDTPDVPPTKRTPLYDFMIETLRIDISAHTQDKRIISAAKNLAKIAKYLRAFDRYSTVLDTREHAGLLERIDAKPASPADGQRAIVDALRCDDLSLEDVVIFFAENAHRGAVLAADASGRIAHRSWPSVT